MSDTIQLKPRKKPRKYRTEDYLGFKIRFIDPAKQGSKGDRHKTPYWLVDNCKAGKNRERVCFETLDEAKGHAKRMAGDVAEHGLSAFALDPAQRHEAARAVAKLKGRASLSDMLKFWERHHPDGTGIPLSKMEGEWIAAQEKDGLMPTTIRQNRQRVKVFVKEMGEETPCAVVTPDKAQGFIESRDCGKVTRESWRKTLRAFFGFVVERKAVEVNPVPERKRRKGAKMAGKSIPVFMAAKKVETFMQKAEELHPESVPALAVMFFAGLRPFEVGGQYGLESSEMTAARTAVFDAKKRLKEAEKRGGKSERDARAALGAAREKLVVLLEEAKKARRKAPAMMGGLDWSNVNLAKRFIRVLPETSKTGAGRLVDISDNLFLWLTKYYRASGPVAPPPPTFKRHRQDIMKKAELKRWLPDVARHTYATMHFAMHENQDKLQAMMGHSGKAYILTAHYKGLATKGEAETFWGIKPAGATGAAQDGQVLQLATKGA